MLDSVSRQYTEQTYYVNLITDLTFVLNLMGLRSYDEIDYLLRGTIHYPD